MDDIAFVVDYASRKLEQFDLFTDLDHLISVNILKCQVNRRAGRAGRTRQL